MSKSYLLVRAQFAAVLLKALGWRFKTSHSVDLTQDQLDQLPPKWVVFGEPHTHLFDIVLMLLFFWRYRLPKVHFPVRAKYFYPGLGVWLRFMGAIPVKTSKKNNLVDQLVEQMRQADTMILHIPPSGTRRRTDRWRSGFYHIASQAEVPVFPAYLDASTKTFGYGSPIYLTGDIKKDMDRIRAFYADKRGIVPKNESTIRLKEESEL